MSIRSRLRAAGMAVAVVTSSLAVAAAVAGPAAAGPGSGPAGIGGSSHAATVPLAPSHAAGQVGSGGISPADVSPSGCVGSSNNPHISSHNPDTVNAEARTSCNNPVPEILAEGWLFQLVSGVWTEVGFDSFFNVQATRASAFPNAPFCSGTFYYGLDSFHEVTDVDFNEYDASTASPPVLITCASP